MTDRDLAFQQEQDAARVAYAGHDLPGPEDVPGPVWCAECRGMRWLGGQRCQACGGSGMAAEQPYGWVPTFPAVPA